jgi:hypothetical protein
MKKLFLFLNHFEPASSRSFYGAQEFSVLLGNPLLGFGLIAPLALLGMVFSRRRHRELYFPLSFVWIYLLSALAFFVVDHYRMPVVPVFLLFASYAVNELWVRFKKHRWAGILPAAFFLTPVLIVFNWDSDLQADPRWQAAEEFNLGNKYRDSNQPEFAVQRYRKALVANPGHVPARLALANLLELKSETHAEAVKAWEEINSYAQMSHNIEVAVMAQSHLQKLGVSVRAQKNERDREYLRGLLQKN